MMNRRDLLKAGMGAMPAAIWEPGQAFRPLLLPILFHGRDSFAVPARPT
jgi:hypothetical protein